MNEKVHFNLKQMRETEKLSQIMLVTTINKHRIRVYTKLRVEPKFWDKEKYRCCLNLCHNQRDRNRLSQINQRINQIKNEIQQSNEQLAQKGRYLSSDILRNLVQRIDQQKESLEPKPLLYFREVIANYSNTINRKGKKGVAGTQRTYLTAVKRLEEYCQKGKIRLSSFDDFDKQFFTNFTNYLYSCTYGIGEQQKQYTKNTVVNTLKVLKNLLRRAYDDEVSNNTYFQRVQTVLNADASEQIYLDEEEIEKLKKLQLTNKQEIIIRDMFIIACYTALRISDLQNLDTAVIQKGIISIYQKKTTEQAEIPIMKKIDKLIRHYQKVGFPKFDETNANIIIKDLAKRCGITGKVMRKEHRGGVVKINTYSKYQLVSFHTARRSCITNLYKQGYAYNFIMILSGHRTEEALRRYIRASISELTIGFMKELREKKAIAIQNYSTDENPPSDEVVSKSGVNSSEAQPPDQS